MPDRINIVLAFLLSLSPVLAAVSFCQDAAFDMEPIVVAKNNTPGDYYSINFKRGGFYGAYTGIEEALARTPLDIQSRGPVDGIQSDYSLRGSNYQGVKVMLAGKSISDPQTAHHNCDMPMTREDIESAQVLAPEGAVNFIIKKPLENRDVLEVSAANGDSLFALYSLSRASGGSGIRLSLENRESQGLRPESEFRKTSFFLSSLSALPAAEVYADLGYQEKEFGAYDFYTPAKGYPSKEWTKTILFNTAAEMDSGPFVLKPSFIWRRHYDKFMLDKYRLLSSYQSCHRTDSYGVGMELQRRSASSALGIGAQYGKEAIGSTSLGSHERNRRSLYAECDSRLSERMDLNMRIGVDDYDSLPSEMSASAVLRSSITRHASLHLGVFRVIREPSFTELYYDDPTTQGSLGLKPESSLGLEAGWQLDKESRSLGITLFTRKQSDFIDWIKRSAGDPKWSAQNIGSYRVNGLEAYAQKSFWGAFRLDSGYSYIDRRDDDAGAIYKYGANHFMHLLRCALVFEPAFGRQELEFLYKKKPGRDGWLLFNANLSRRIGKGSSIFLKASNIFNSEYQQIEGIGGIGRYVECGVRLEW